VGLRPGCRRVIAEVVSTAVMRAIESACAAPSKK
jgi:hypothetical protein